MPSLILYRNFITAKLVYAFCLDCDGYCIPLPRDYCVDCLSWLSLCVIIIFWMDRDVFLSVTILLNQLTFIINNSKEK